MSEINKCIALLRSALLGGEDYTQDCINQVDLAHKEHDSLLDDLAASGDGEGTVKARKGD